MTQAAPGVSHPVLPRGGQKIAGRQGVSWVVRGRDGLSRTRAQRPTRTGAWLYRTLCKNTPDRVGQRREIKERDGEGGGVVLSQGLSKNRGPPLGLRGTRTVEELHPIENRTDDETDADGWDAELVVRGGSS